MLTVIFACTEDADRSKMAAAFFNSLAQGARAEALSGGTRPAGEVDPRTVDVMLELGIDLRRERPQPLTAEMCSEAGLLVTLDAGAFCPAVEHSQREAWFLPDPRGKELADVRRIRDDLRRRVFGLIEREGWLRAAGGDATVS